LINTPTSTIPGRGILGILLICFLFWGVRPLWEPDEGRYAEAAREMLLTNDWLTPRLQGEPHLTKPPFTYWLTASGIWLLGVNAWGARLFLSVAFFLCAVSTMGIARTWGWSNRQVFLSGLVFSTALLPFICGHVLTTDMFLASWETIGVLCAWRTWNGAGKTRYWRIGFWMAFGLAFLTKGPPGWLPLPVILLYSMIVKRRCHQQQPDSGLWSWRGFILLLIIAFGWFVALCMKNADLFSYFLGEEVRDRILSDRHERTQPYYLYFLLLFLGLIPWIFMWPGLVVRSLKYMGPVILKEGNKHKLFSLIWVILPLLIFQFSKSKMYLYIIPLFVPISLWCGYLLGRSGCLFYRLADAKSLVLTVPAVMWMIVLVAITVFPDSSRYSRGVRDLATDLKRKSEQQGLRLEMIYTTGKPPHSLSFYTGIPLQEEERDREKISFKMQAELRTGSRTGLLIRRHRVEEHVGLSGIDQRVLAGNDRYIIFIVDGKNHAE
jgi:4-amino-4-deoxy-L-arabinose transferase-like glycosyltransferase